MTRERLNELVRQSKSQAHLDYLLGRETAIEKISSGMADQYINHQGLGEKQLSRKFLPEWRINT